MKKIFIFLLVSIFLLSFTSALLEVSNELPSLKENLEISESANIYPAIQIGATSDDVAKPFAKANAKDNLYKLNNVENKYGI